MISPKTGRVFAVFQPHTYSRTKAFFKGFCEALSKADRVILTDIYPAREEPIEGITSEKLAVEVGERASYCTDDKVIAALDIKTHGVIVVMGAGDLEDIKNEILNTGEAIV